MSDVTRLLDAAAADRLTRAAAVTDDFLGLDDASDRLVKAYPVAADLVKCSSPG